MITKTYIDLANFDHFAKKFKEQNSKIAFAIMKVTKCKGYLSYLEDRKKLQENYNEKVLELQDQFAEVDDNGFYILDEKNEKKFKKESLDSIKIELKKLLEITRQKDLEIENKPYEIEPWFCEPNQKLTVYEMEAFKDIILTEDSYNKLKCELE